jgi:hypothetical protein
MTQKQWSDRGKAGGWEMNMIAVAAGDQVWGVDTNGRVGKWDCGVLGWTEQPQYGLIKMLAFDNLGNPWCVKQDGSLAKWDMSNATWNTQPNNWALDMVAFDKTGLMYGVGTNHNVGRKTETSPTWDDLGTLGNWAIRWLAFNPADNTDEVFCVGTGFNLGRYELDRPGDMQPVNQSWALKMVAFGNNLAWAVGTGSNVGNVDSL